MTPQDTVNNLLVEFKDYLGNCTFPDSDQDLLEFANRIASLTARAMISKPIPDVEERKGWSNDYIVGYSARVVDELILADLIEKL